MFTGTTVQAASYLLGVCLFSIAFLVFLNSSVSFVVTDLLKQQHGVGNAVGTLGFADELVAVVACPAWGILSDRIGVRAVSALLCRLSDFLKCAVGLCHRLRHHWARIILVCSSTQCLSSVASREIVLQYRWGSKLDYGHSYASCHDYSTQSSQLLFASANGDIDEWTHIIAIDIIRAHHHSITA